MTAPDVLCFSHLRWNFVFQRPNHLMTRCARSQRVFFVEEPCLDEDAARLEMTRIDERLFRVVPHLPQGLTRAAETSAFAQLLGKLHDQYRISEAIHWYYSPMFVPATRNLSAVLTVYDCMDELSGFKGAPPELALREQDLLARTDVMFTGGMALYEAKRVKHPNVHGVPSSVDVAFFAQARAIEADPEDQAAIPEPRIGYYGVIDERIDLELVDALASARPDWHIVMMGPLAKIDESMLPRRPNIHYLGMKSYAELPSYVAGWDVAFMPFALNDATRFISPTKTPEYLAAGKPVVSTAITDVVEPYERLGLVRVGRSVEDFITHVGRALSGEMLATDAQRDEFLANMSWDATWERMQRQLTAALNKSASSRVHAAE
jgi:glycosyltransferase involved in cell wall biosynthesis